MSIRHTRLARLGAAAVCTIALTTGGATLAVSAGAAESAVAARPLMKIPFPCGEEWRGATFAGHGLPYAIDLNKGGGDDDWGMPVKASAAGTVESIRYYASTPSNPSWGHTVEIRHGGGWTSFYAHLKGGTITVSEGQSVSASTTIAQVGKSGDQSSSHLHYEQRLNGDDKPIVFGERAVVYYSTDYYTRTRC